MRNTIVAITLAVLVLAAAGCGGGGSSSSAQLSASEFQAKANAICSGHKLNLQHMTSAHDFDTALRVTKDTYTQLKALNPPASLQAAYQAYLDSTSAGISVLTKLVRAADNNEFAKVAKLAPQAASLVRRNQNAARAAGLHVCAEA